MKFFPAFQILCTIVIVSCTKSDRAELSLVFTESNVTFTKKMPIERGQKRISASTYQVLRESGVKFEGNYQADGTLRVRIECKTGDDIEAKEVNIEINETTGYSFESGVTVSIDAQRIKS